MVFVVQRRATRDEDEEEVKEEEKTTTTIIITWIHNIHAFIYPWIVILCLRIFIYSYYSEHMLEKFSIHAHSPPASPFLLCPCPPRVLQFAVNKRECSIIIIISFLPLYCVERISRYHTKFTTIHLSRPRDLLFPPSSLLRNQTCLSSLSPSVRTRTNQPTIVLWYTKDPLALNCKSFMTRISEVGACLSLHSYLTYSLAQFASGHDSVYGISRGRPERYQYTK